jgi:hypothetical protein
MKLTRARRRMGTSRCALFDIVRWTTNTSELSRVPDAMQRERQRSLKRVHARLRRAMASLIRGPSRIGTVPGLQRTIRFAHAALRPGHQSAATQIRPRLLIAGRTNLHVWSAGSVVCGLLFTMKIPTQACEPSASAAVNAQHRHPSLPGLTRQSIVFEKSFCENRWAPRSSPGATRAR